MMPIRSIEVRGYRSVQRVFVRLGQVNVLEGPNGCGKSNLYRSLFLLAAAAEGRFARSLASEGGMESALWAGAYSKGVSKRIVIEVQFDEWTYCFECGLPAPSESAFQLDPLIRSEELWFHGGGRKTSIFRRENGLAQLRNEAGQYVRFPDELSDAESILSELREPQRYPELSTLRGVLLGWRFYHQFRTDAESPLRRPQIGVKTPILGHDGADLAAALRTIIEIGERDALAEAVSAAFPGGCVEIESTSGGMEVVLQLPGFNRPFRASELSDGTLKYLCLAAALFSPRPPTLLALNEPDANLHERLYAPLARMIAQAGKNSQIWITTHSPLLARLLRHEANANVIRLEKRSGATVAVSEQAGNLPE
jgi:predicted ATPase